MHITINTHGRQSALLPGAICSGTERIREAEDIYKGFHPIRNIRKAFANRT